MSVAVILGVVLIVLGVGFGVLMIFAGGMSDAPQAGEDTARSGVWLIVFCLVVGGVMISSHWWHHYLSLSW